MLNAIMNRLKDVGGRYVDPDSTRIDWLRVSPFLLLHAACLLVFWVGASWFAVLFAFVSYALRAMAVCAFYHRYFSHRTFKTNRFWQFLFAAAGASAVQRGPLWWASHHRNHHAYSDQPNDSHSPVQNGFLWSHMGWFMSKKYYHYDKKRIEDFAAFPELRWLDRLDMLVPISYFVLCFLIGHYCAVYYPELHTNGMQMLIWGGCISTIFLFHVTGAINSIAHKYGKRRYANKDESRNNWLLALFAFGEGWHNNHHHYPACVDQGFFWWEVDLTLYFILFMEKLGIVRDVKRVPDHVLNANLVNP